jgi:hypothetical protein
MSSMHEYSEVVKTPTLEWYSNVNMDMINNELRLSEKHGIEAEWINPEPREHKATSNAERRSTFEDEDAKEDKIR